MKGAYYDFQKSTRENNPITEVNISSTYSSDFTVLLSFWCFMEAFDYLIIWISRVGVRVKSQVTGLALYWVFNQQS